MTAKGSDGDAGVGSKGTVAFFVSNGPVGSSPGITNSARALARAGYDVVVFAERAYHFEDADLADPRIKLCVLDRGNTRLGRVGGRALRSAGGPFMPVQYRVVPRTSIKRAAARVPIDSLICVVGFDAYGLVFAGAVNDLLPRRAPLLYYSLELFLSYGHAGLDYSEDLKALERRYHREARVTIVQDEERAALLLADNRVEGSPVLIVPNGPMGAAQRERSSYLRELHGIDDSKRIVLHAGGLNEFGRCREIVRAAGDFPPGWVLVLHGPSNASYLEQLKSEAGPNTLFSTEILGLDDLKLLLCSCDVGVAFYRALNPGLYHIAKASGKIGHYLQCGLPVVASDFDNLKQVLEGWGCGLCVSDPSDLARGVAEILDDYDRYRENAFKCYEREYEFARHFEDVIGLIDELGPAGRAGQGRVGGGGT